MWKGERSKGEGFNSIIGVSKNDESSGGEIVNLNMLLVPLTGKIVFMHGRQERNNSLRRCEC